MKNRWQRKDRRRRLRVDQYAMDRMSLKARVRDVRTSESDRVRAREILRTLPRDTSATRVCNRCVETGRGHAVMRVFRRSRFVIRDRALKGLLPGVKKRS